MEVDVDAELNEVKESQNQEDLDSVSPIYKAQSRKVDKDDRVRQELCYRLVSNFCFCKPISFSLTDLMSSIMLWQPSLWRPYRTKKR